MLYGPAKRRQMARSILPSRAGKQARADLRLIHRRYRRSVTQKLRTDTRVLGAAPDESFDLGDHTSYPSAEIRDVVRERRYADTLNHFERWAIAVTRDVRTEDRLSWLRAGLPDGLIGAHAESHLRWLPEICALEEHDWRWRYSSRRTSPSNERADTESALHQALERGLHAELNRQLRYALSERLLLGRHDVGDFAGWVVRCTRGVCDSYCDHPALDAVRQFIERYGAKGRP